MSAMSEGELAMWLLAAVLLALVSLAVVWRGR